MEEGEVTRPTVARRRSENMSPFRGAPHSPPIIKTGGITSSFSVLFVDQPCGVETLICESIGEI